MSAFGRIFEQLFNQINVCHDHTAAAIPLAAKGIHSISVRHPTVDKVEETLPEIASDLATGEASDGNNHFDCCEGVLALTVAQDRYANW